MAEESTTHFEQMGGAAGIRSLVDRFYDIMDADPAAAGIRLLHPESLEGSRENLYLFLTGWTGGPPLYVQRRGHPMLRARHLPFPIGVAERDAWITCMERALDDQEMPADLRDYLKQRFRAVADHMRNRSEGGG